ncbi:lipid-A-disaccharide synthase [soil metagenome]
MTRTLRIALVAGEPSGDLLAASLLEALARRWPQARFEGIGGPRMTQAGFEALWPMTALSVHGFADALRHYRSIKRIRDQLAARLVADPPDLFIGVDAPDFNLGLERQLKRRGIRTVHFVSPSIWAWRGGRLRSMPGAVDLMLCLFPFEPALYEHAGIVSSYVGHPLADRIPAHPDAAAARRRLGLAPTRPWLAVLPGSREGEVRRIGPTFAQAIARLKRDDPSLGIVIPAATPALRTQIEAILAEAGLEPPTVTVFDGHSHDIIEASDVVLVASGTATLECALYKKPMVIAYKVGSFNYKLMKRMAYLPWIGLPNILLRETVVPEFVQHAATPEALAGAVRHWFDDGQARAAIELRFEGLRRSLAQGMAHKAIAAIEHRWPELAAVEAAA